MVRSVNIRGGRGSFDAATNNDWLIRYVTIIKTTVVDIITTSQSLHQATKSSVQTSHRRRLFGSNGRVQLQ